MNTKNEKVEFLQRMIEAVKKVPIQKIIGNEVELVQRGQNFLGLCPFHPDNHLGSFVVSPAKNIYKCFACGAVGNGISFIMEYYECNFLKAVFKIAIDFNLITAEEYEQYSKKKYDDSVLKRIETETNAEKPKLLETKKAPLKIVNVVYSAMASACGLNDVHKKHLLNDRKISPESLKDFFTFPTRHVDLPKKILLEVRKNIIEEKLGKTDKTLTPEELTKVSRICQLVAEFLPFVPGFFVNQKGNIDFVSHKGIGILARDENGMARGIQIRRDTIKPGESRYIWFSSGFATMDDSCQGGNPSGSPGGVVYGKDNTNLFLTEGRFKAEALTQLDTGNAIYVSGVSTWKSVLPLIKNVYFPGRLFLVFDADSLGNVAVFKQLHAFYEELVAEKYSPKILLWPKSKGKGFDDFYNNVGYAGIKKYCKNYNPENLFELQKNIVEEALMSFNVQNIKDLKTDEVEKFSILLQQKMEEKIFNQY